ncbi:MAG: FKBP-type peptidyl-prolyl cis-trans isomerase [Candidatus Rokubacteria bacterium]|nr:FKBP-type peptidyl-prolyl cis-trans isomerase [Candidatus Rokubacteria bacterium]
MNHRSPWSAAAIALALAALAADAPAQKAPQSEDEKTLYVLGVSLARNLEPFRLNEDELQFIVAGLRDEVTGKPSQVAVEEYGPKIRELAQARQNQTAQEEKTAGAEFLTKEAAASGASKTSSGLIKRVLKEGSGPSPKAEDTVKVHYHGTLRDGTVFDSSVDRGEPATFGLDRVIPCWTEAVQTMKVGEKAHITCPPDIAYGDRGAPPRIKPGAALAFDVELLEIVKKPEAPPAAAQ